MNSTLRWMAPCAAIVLAASSVSGQVADIQPAYAVVTSEKAALRCSDSDRFYQVAELMKAAVVVVDGEGGGWSRVKYPAGTAAFVRAEDVRVEGASVVLTQGSRLKAAHGTAGYEGSYKALLSTPLAAGATLKLIEPAKDPTGAISGYKVIAPEGARGFVESRHLRRATEAEIEAFRAKTGAPALTTAPATTPATSPATTPATTPATSPGTTPTTSPATTPAATPAASPGAGALPSLDGGKPETGSLLTPMVPGQGQPTTTPVPGEATPASAGGPAATTPEATTVPGGGPTAVVVTPKAPEPDRAIATAQKLEQTFQVVWRQPILESEFDELVAEYDRAIEATPPERANLRAALQSRRQALEVRRQFRDVVRRQAEERAAIDKSKAESDKTLEALAASRYYTIIGQVQPSLIYDGKQLPLMYRIVSVGGVTPRTLGYLRKSDKVDLDKVVGQVVGVIGDAQLDRSLQLNLITPVQVDVLKYAPAGTAAPSGE
ncbi:MAG: OmpH family outer membrane protein [Leptolyngbya sp. PLA1]|nr:OmpH family outer membrane protein [Leptolyngbya sp. PLA1]